MKIKVFWARLNSSKELEQNINDWIAAEEGEGGKIISQQTAVTDNVIAVTILFQ